MVPRELTLALGALGGFLGSFLVLLGFAGVQVGLLAVTAGLFAEPLAAQFALGLVAARGDESEDQQDDDYDDDGYEQSG
jgi:hypothetical protein